MRFALLEHRHHHLLRGRQRSRLRSTALFLETAITSVHVAFQPLMARRPSHPVLAAQRGYFLALLHTLHELDPQTHDPALLPRHPVMSTCPRCLGINVSAMSWHQTGRSQPMELHAGATG